MAISFVSAASIEGNSIPMPAHQAGDLLVIYAFNAANATFPTGAAGWNVLTSRSANALGGLLRWKQATSSAEVSGTWGNATHLAVAVYRDSANYLALGSFSMTGGSTLSPAFNVVNSRSGGNWHVGVMGANLNSQASDTAPVGMTKRTSAAGAVIGKIALHDTGAAVSWPTTTITVASAVAYQSFVAEITDTGVPKPSLPTAAAIAVADLGDGTGATATITGTDAGAGNAVNVYAFDGAASGLALVGTFTRTGDGTVPLALAAGTYFAQLVSNDYTAGSPTFFAVTDAEQCLWDEILDAVVAKIQSLPLAGIAADQVRRGKLPIQYADIGTVGVLVAPMRETITPAGNRKDNLGYGCLVTCFKASNGDNYSHLGAELKWRDQIETAFKIKPGYSPLSTVEEVFNISIEPGSVVLPEAFLQANYDAGSIVLRVSCKQNR